MELYLYRVKTEQDYNELVEIVRTKSISTILKHIQDKEKPIKIGEINKGYKFLFQANQQFKSFAYLKKLLENKKYIWRIEDLYSKVYSLQDFYSIVNSNQNGKSNIDESIIKVYKDKDGYEFTT
jgi:hypothetical protein